jgi:poly(A) polymerase
MTSAAAREVLAALAKDGRPARFVGGCVRNALLGRPASDIDIATSEPPERAIALLAAAGLKAIPTGIDHGTVTVVVGEDHFEVTTLRHDVETYGRRAKVEFTDDWAADAARRDFTFNAIFADPDGTLYDPTGGMADLRERRVRFVGDAKTRIEEDVLRLLRFFRFYAWYGAPPPDANALAACRALAWKLPTLSSERVWAEMRRLLEAPDPTPAVELAIENGVAAHVLPGKLDVDRLRRLVAIEEALSVPLDPIRRLASLLTIDPEAAVALSERLRHSNSERNYLSRLMARRGAIKPTRDPRGPRRALYEHGRETFRDVVLLSWAANGATPGDEAWTALWHAANEWSAPRLPVAGADVMALGIPKGPAVGTILAEIEKWWVARDFAPSREACLQKLQDLARSHKA